MRNIEQEEILNVIENLKSKIDELSDLALERTLTEEERREQGALIKALELVKFELLEPRLTVQL